MSKRALEVPSDPNLPNKAPKVGLFVGFKAVFVGMGSTLKLSTPSVVMSSIKSLSLLFSKLTTLDQSGREDIQFGILRSNFIKNGGEVVPPSSHDATVTHIVCRTNQVASSEHESIQASGTTIFTHATRDFICVMHQF
jgi:hypothetical protein